MGFCRAENSQERRPHGKQEGKGGGDKYRNPRRRADHSPWGSGGALSGLAGVLRDVGTPYVRDIFSADLLTNSLLRSLALSFLEVH